KARLPLIVMLNRVDGRSDVRAENCIEYRYRSRSDNLHTGDCQYQSADEQPELTRIDVFFLLMRRHLALSGYQKVDHHAEENGVECHQLPIQPQVCERVH